MLRGVNLFLPRGRAVGLVGVNGAGKSTLVKLLCRLYDPTHGAVLWDGVDLRDLPVEAVRERISAAFQDYMTYELTAAENIAVGDLRALDDRRRIAHAAARAGAHGVIAGLPRGYDTLLSRQYFGDLSDDDPESGVLLSGGQWQRVALARALLRDGRDLLILDEPSAALDADAEAELHARLREHRAGRTSLLISHRLSSLRDADLIAVLRDGSVVEAGRHDELMAYGGTYARLFTLQARGYRPSSRPPAPRLYPDAGPAAREWPTQRMQPRPPARHPGQQPAVARPHGRDRADRNGEGDRRHDTDRDRRPDQGSDRGWDGMGRSQP